MRLLLALALLSVPTFLAVAQEPAPQPVEPVEPVTVIFVRHGETAGDTSGGGNPNPDLSEVGRARAERLAKLFAHADVDAVYASEFARTQQTVTPLAKKHGLEVQPMSARDRQAQLEALRALAPGSVAVVGGHSNTVPAMVEALAGKVTRLEEHPRAGWLIPHADYSRIYVVTLPGNKGAAASWLELSY